MAGAEYTASVLAYSRANTRRISIKVKRRRGENLRSSNLDRKHLFLNKVTIVNEWSACRNYERSVIRLRLIAINVHRP